MYDIKNICEVKTVEDAIHALEADPQALVIAGGSDVLIKIREGKLAGCSLVGIREIKELAGVSLDGAGAVHIGPVSYTHLHKDWECTEEMMKLTKGGKALYMHCLPADISGVSCKAVSYPHLDVYTRQGKIPLRKLPLM